MDIKKIAGVGVAICMMVVLLGCFVEAPLEAEPELASKEAVGTLAACIIADTCLVPRMSEVVDDGEEIYFVNIKVPGTEQVRYLLTSRKRFGVSVKYTKDYQIFLEDPSLNGRVDMVTQTLKKGEKAAPGEKELKTDKGRPTIIAYGPQSWRYRRAQEIYVQVMKVAEEEVIPPQSLERAKSRNKKSKV